MSAAAHSKSSSVMSLTTPTACFLLADVATVARVDIIRAQKRKRPNGGGTWFAYLFDEDEYGLWAFCPAGSIHHHHPAGGGMWTCPSPGLQLLTEDRWWVAWWWLAEKPWCAADVCTPVAFEDGAWTYVDLELDCVGDEQGFRELADEDEFVTAVDGGLISPDEVAPARAASADVEALLRNAEAPFGPMPWSRLREAASMKLPPLTDRPA